MKKHWLNAVKLLVLVIVLALGLVGGVLLDRLVLAAFVPLANIPEPAEPQFARLAEAWNIIDRSFVDRAQLQPDQLGDGALRGLVESLGDTGHSRYLTAEQAQRSRNALQGQLEGIGVEVQMKDNQLVVVAPIDGSPAQRAGIKAGDVILKVEGQDITSMPLDDVMSRIIGRAGTLVQLTILDTASSQTHTLTITRATIRLDNVTWAMIPGSCAADIRIAQFSSGVADDLKRAIAEVQQRGVRRVVFDLRNDPGGLVDEAIGVASQFVKSGDLLLEQDAQSHVQHITVRPTSDVYTGTLVVLVNGGTASSAEIVAGALQDHQRAQLVGTPTFGTGTVLDEFKLSDGSELLLATEKWLTPDGRVIWHKGIAPDISVALPESVTPLRPADLADTTPAQLQTSGDAQLIRALHLLGGAAGGACTR